MELALSISMHTADQHTWLCACNPRSVHIGWTFKQSSNIGLLLPTNPCQECKYTVTQWASPSPISTAAHSIICKMTTSWIISLHTIAPDHSAPLSRTDRGLILLRCNSVRSAQTLTSVGMALRSSELWWMWMAESLVGRGGFEVAWSLQRVTTFNYCHLHTSHKGGRK